MVMRFSLMVAVLLASAAVSGAAQQKNTFKVKPSHPEAKAPKSSAPIGPTGSATSPAAASAKNLNAVEHQSLKSQTPKSAGKKSPALKPVKDKPNPPINFNGNGAKASSPVNQGSNPYKGRLRQKHTRQQ
jgi:hypothetical protein